MTRALEGTVALVTGASSGIGEATALRLAAQGATVAVVARRRERLNDLVARISTDGGAALAYDADMTAQGAAAATVAAVVERLGQLDIVVNSAGVMLLGPALEAPVEEWRRMIDINISGLLEVTHAALPHLVEAAERSPRRVADMVNLSSVAGRITSPASAVYNLTKFGVAAFSEALRAELAPRHVRVSVIEPGLTNTELASHVRDEAQQGMKDRFEGVEPLEAGDVGDAITWLVTLPRRVAGNELLLRPTNQTT